MEGWLNFEEAEPAFEEALRLARKIHDVDSEARTAYNLGMIQLFHRRPDEAAGQPGTLDEAALPRRPDPR